MGWTTIASGLFGVGKPITSAIGLGLYSNPISGLASEAGAPVSQVGWHPYDSTVNGTGAGIAYSFAVSGAVANFESPAFADGYEYAFLFDKLTTTFSGNITLEVFRDTSAAYSTVRNIMASASSVGTTGWLEFRLPRKVLTNHLFYGSLVNPSGADIFASPTDISYSVSHGTAQKIGKIRLGASASAVSISGGNIYMYRRRID